jgi:hypothetical protein
MVFIFEHFEKSIRNTWKVLKCDAEKGGTRSDGPIVWEMKKGYRDKEERNNLQT